MADRAFIHRKLTWDTAMSDDKPSISMRRRKFLTLAGLGILTAAIPGMSETAQELDKRAKGGITTMAHELPPLPYDYDALEPYYSKEILTLHHDKHHATYVNGLNAAEEKVRQMAQSEDFGAVHGTMDNLAFNGSGHILHSIFWTNMKPNGGGEPTGELAEAIKKHFGSYDAFKNLFLAASNQVQGSGWGILAYRKMDDALVVLAAEKHENLAQWGVEPILVLDVWEHAYYLQYQNRRPDWTRAFMEHLVNWDNVAERYAAAKK
jgi:Fe-Mn family superoxide dismutase